MARIAWIGLGRLKQQQQIRQNQNQREGKRRNAGQDRVTAVAVVWPLRVIRPHQQKDGGEGRGGVGACGETGYVV